MRTLPDHLQCTRITRPMTESALHAMIDDIHQRNENKGTRALMGALLSKLKRGQNTLRKDAAGEACNGHSALTTASVAKLMRVGEVMITAARVVIRHGTEEEIKGIEDGKVSVRQLAIDIRQGKPPHQRGMHGAKSWVSHAGRKMPNRATAQCMERGLDQLNNAICAIDQLCHRPDAAGHPQFSEWIAALRKSRTNLSQLLHRMEP